MVKIQYWMQALQESRKLVDLCLPGSHDAGVYRDERKDVTPGDSARCQYENIGEQASCGSRVFDIRCFLRTAGLINRTKTPTMGHFFADKAPLGDYGGALASALEDALNFVKIYPSEFLIFRIGHTECLEEVGQVLEVFYNKPDDKGMLSNSKRFYRAGPGNLAHVEVSQLRGKLVILCDNEELDSSHFQPGNGYCLYEKYPPSTPSTSAQIRFCGKYTGDLKTAAKTFKKDKGNWSSEGAVQNAVEACQTHKGHPSDHLFWIYWQETGGNVLKNTTDAQGMHNRLDNFLSAVRASKKDPQNTIPLPNIIGHDFVNRFTCGAIAKMNDDVSTQLEPYGY